MFERSKKAFPAFAVVMALLLCLPSVASAAAVEVAPSQSVKVTVSLPRPDSGSGEFNAFKAKISYDKGVFQPLTQEDFACKAPWRSLSYNPETMEFAAASTRPVASGSEVAVVTLKALDGAKTGVTNVGLESPVASGGAGDVALHAATLPISVKASSEPGGNPEVADGSWRDTSSDTSPDASSSPTRSYMKLGDDAGQYESALAKTGDAGCLVPFAVLAIAASCLMAFAAVKCLRHRSAPSKGAVAIVALAAVVAVSGVCTVTVAFADGGAGYDANRDGKVDAKDVEYVADVLVGLKGFDASTDLNSDGSCTVDDLAIEAKYVYSLPGYGEGGSDSPDIPDSPGQPSGPDDPAKPENPIGPSDPSSPDNPDEPDGPGNPDDPSDPANPSDPDDPSDSDSPDDPDDPVESTRFEGYMFEQVEPQDIPVTYTEYQMRTDRMKELGYYGDHSQWPVGLELSSDGALALVGTDCCGLYRSDDQGQTWDQAHTGFNALSTSLFAIDPNNSSHALVLSGSRLDDGKKYAGVYETVDGAHTWSQTEKVQPADPAEDPYNIMVRSWRYTWDGFEFDPATYDASLQKTTDVYLSLPYARDTDRVEDTAVRKPKSSVYTYLPPEKAGLYKSTDGGSTFTFLKQGLELCDGILKFSGTGDMYIANQYGLHLVDKQTGEIVRTFFENTGVGDGLTESTLGEKVSFEFSPGKTRDVYKAYMGVTGFDVVGSTLYVQTWDGIYKSKTDNLASDADFEIIPSTNYIKRWPKHLTVSKRNPDHMVMEVKNTLASYYTNYLYYSLDGGVTWSKSNWDQDTIFTQPTDWNSIERFICFDETDPEGMTIVANGNGVITRSTDGGANFVQTNGISNIMAGGKFHLNYYDPDLVTFGCQDFTGAISANNGDTWTQMHARKKDAADPEKFDNTRSMYAAYSPDGETVVGWGINKQYETPTLMVSYEGGTRSSTWIDTGIETCITDNLPAFSTIQSYNDPDVIITNEWRSEDRGRTWARMEGCRSAYTVNYTGRHEMYGGSYDGKPVVSYDEGKTWEPLYEGERFCPFYATVAGTEKIEDIALDHVNNILYCVVRFSTQYGGGAINKGATRVVKMKIGEPDSRKTLDIKFYAGYRNIRGVAVDPNSTSVVYVASVANNVLNPTGLYRSIDGGETFTNLTSSLFYYKDEASGEDVRLPNKALNQGGYEPQYVRVDPRTGRCIIGTCCYGYEWVNPPYDESLLRHAAPSAHSVTYSVGGETVGEETIRNGHWWKDGFVPSGAGEAFDGWYTNGACTIRMQPNTPVLDSMVLYGKK